MVLRKSASPSTLTIYVDRAFNSSGQKKPMDSLKRAPETMLKWLQNREHSSRSRRVKISMTVMLELGPHCTVKAIIDDLSKDGFRLRSRAILHPGQLLKMQLHRETVACQLRWTDGFEAGGVFCEHAEVREW